MPTLFFNREVGEERIERWAMGTRSVVAEDDVLGEFVEVGGFLEGDGHLGIDFLAALELDVLLADGLDDGQIVLDKNLSSLDNERNAFSHTLHIQMSMLLEDQLAQKQSLIEFRGFPDTVHVRLVELGTTAFHQLRSDQL
jgi:hypothetical protein